MTLWTIQHEDAFAELKRTGVLRADGAHLMFGGEYRRAYDWMAMQLRRRIGPPPEGARYPLWAWYQWEGARKRRDLRCSGYAPRGTPMVQLTFEIGEAEVLLSDFDAWHLVLAGDYLADSELDWENFRGGEAETAASWERIFDLDRHTPGWDTPPQERSIQAVFWELRWSQIRKTEHFIAK